MESLFVLAIVSFFIALPALAVKEAIDTLTTLHFFDRLEKSILTSQQTAIISNKKTDIIQDYDNQRILAFQLQTGEWLEHLIVPETLTVGSISPKISFSAGTGNASAYRTIRFTWPKKNQRITYRFLFGKGHYEQTIEPL